MPKILQAYNTDYHIIAQNDGVITLDTTGCENDQSGTVIIKGDLEVLGDTTTVSSTDLNLSDNIILLSEGGLTQSMTTSGIEIDRGVSRPRARWIYDDTIPWEMGLSQGIGSFYAAQGIERIPLTIPGINAQGTLYIDTGAGAISVTNTPDYEARVFNYDSSLQFIEPDDDGFIVKDDDFIPNAKAVKDYIDYNFTERSVRLIAEGNTRVEAIDEQHALLDIVSIDIINNYVRISTSNPHGFTLSDTIEIFGVEANGNALENINQSPISINRILNNNTVELNISLSGADEETYIPNSGIIRKVSFQETRIEFEVEGNLIAALYGNRFETGDIEFKNNEIITTSSNSDLVLKSSSIGSVKVDDTLLISPLPYDEDPNQIPLAPDEGVKLYTSTPGPGAVGVYYVNNNNRNDELISKNRSLLFGMLF
jgi:hypothetical protein